MKRISIRPWPRWARVTRNLLLSLLLALFLWASVGAPLPKAAAVRRFERECLVPYGETVLELEEGEAAFTPVCVSASGEAVVAVGPYLQWLDRLEGDGPTLLPLRTTIYSVGWGSILSHPAYMLVHPAAGTASAKLTVHNQQGDFTAQGERRGEVFFFVMPDPNGWSSRDWWEPEGYTYDLTCYDAAGGVLYP